MGFSNVYGIPGLPGVARDSGWAPRRLGSQNRVATEVEDAAARGEAAPSPVTILVAEDPASKTYVAAKHRACGEVGIGSSHHSFAADASHGEIAACIEALYLDPDTSGILESFSRKSSLPLRWSSRT